MFAALSWLLDLNATYSSSSSSSEADSVSYQHSRSSSRSSTCSRVMDVPHGVPPPTTFTDARGEAVVAELHVNATPATTTTTAIINNTFVPNSSTAGQGLRRDVQQQQRERESSLFADLHAQSTTLFASCENHDEISFSATSQQTVLVWNISTYTSDTVSISPLPSPSYGQAPADPSAAFYSLAEHGTAVITPPLGTTGAGRTLWASDGAVLSVCLPASTEVSRNNESNNGGHATTAQTGSERMVRRRTPAAAPVAVVEPRRHRPTEVGALGRDSLPGLTVPLRVPNVASPADLRSYTPVTAGRIPPSGATGAAVLTPQSRILAWDQEVHEGRALVGDAEPSGGEVEAEEEVAAVLSADDPSPAHLAPEHAATATFACMSEDAAVSLSLASPYVADHVVPVRPSNPFLMNTAATSDAAPTAYSGNDDDDNHHRDVDDFILPLITVATAASTAPFSSSSSSSSSAAPAPLVGKDRPADSVVRVSLTRLGSDEPVMEGDSADAFMAHALRQRTEELLLSSPSHGAGAKAVWQPSSSSREEEAVAAGSSGVVELGNGLVTLEARTPQAPPPKTAASCEGKPVFDFS